MAVAQKLVLARRPGDTLEPSVTEQVTAPIPDVQPDTFLVEVSHITLDVSMLGWMRAGRSYLPNIQIGDAIRATAVGTVVSSKHPEFATGDLVTGLFGAQTHVLSDGRGVVKLDPAAATAEEWAGSLGLTTAFTSYVGLSFAPSDLHGKTVVVSGASGLVGGYAAQLARLRGARVIGIAGGAQNCDQATTTLQLDGCIDYRTADFATALRAACPDRVDVFFDNVGGPIFDDTLGWMNAFGTVVMCGQTAERGNPQPASVTNIRNVIMERLTVRGFVVLDHPELFALAAQALAQYVKQGELRPPHADIACFGGLAAFHDAYDSLIHSNQRGKRVLIL